MIQKDISFTSTAGESSITKSSSELSSRLDTDQSSGDTPPVSGEASGQHPASKQSGQDSGTRPSIPEETQNEATSGKSDELVGTISYVEDDGIIEAHRIVYSQALVSEATLVKLVPSN